MKEVFFQHLKDQFFPKLREHGFKGSGQNFRRLSGEVIHTINIQANKYGGSCCVNLGLHLSFLPYNWSENELPDAKKIKEIDCEFRGRLSEKGIGDQWWKYDGGLFGSAKSSSTQLMNTYWHVGEPLLQKYQKAEDFVTLYSLEQLKEKDYLPVFGGITRQRAALVMARILSHLDKKKEAREFARIGLDHLGRAISLKPQLEEFITSQSTQCR